MKKLILIAFAAVLAIFALQSCEKQSFSSLNPTDPSIKTRKTQTRQFSFDTLLFTGATNADSVKWTVSPEGESYFRIKKNVAVISFFRTGTYTISAQKLSGGPVKTITMTVVPYTPPPFESEPGTDKTNVVTSTTDTTNIISITGDVQIGCSFYRIPSGDSVHLNFDVRTVNDYCSKGIIQYSSTIDAARNFSLNILNIRAPKNCAGATAPDHWLWVGETFKKKLIGIGTHQIAITYNGVTYNGTIVVTSTQITINWSYTSGVVMLTNVING